ncbi:MAG: TrmH family RNA methyltransferase [Patescibacteria group bacterium]
MKIRNVQREAQKEAEKQRVYLVLDNIRSVHNVGSIFRTADCLGVSKIFLVGVTPTPKDRFDRVRKDFAKVSLGAENLVAWEHVSDLSKLLSKFKKQNVSVVAVEQASNSKDYRKIEISYPVAFIFGNEVEGVSEKILKRSDIIAEIPMKGSKESLNVSVAVGIALAQFLD